MQHKTAASAMSAILLACYALSIGQATSADAPGPKSLDGTGIVAPTEPIARAAFDVLYKNCSRCHQQQLLEPPIIAPQGGLDNILSLSDLAADGRYVVPGSATNSPLYQKVAIYKQ